VKDGQIDNSVTPEVAALRSLSAIATDAKQVLGEFEPQQVFEQLKQTPEEKKSSKHLMNCFRITAI
jgi:pyruvate, water dikinase